MTTAAIASFFRPVLLLLVFAAIVIPLRLLILRVVPPTWRAILSSPVSVRDRWIAWGLTMGAIIVVPLLL